MSSFLIFNVYTIFSVVMALVVYFILSKKSVDKFLIYLINLGVMILTKYIIHYILYFIDSGYGIRFYGPRYIPLFGNFMEIGNCLLYGNYSNSMPFFILMLFELFAIIIPIFSFNNTKKNNRPTQINEKTKGNQANIAIISITCVLTLGIGIYTYSSIISPINDLISKGNASFVEIFGSASSRKVTVNKLSYPHIISILDYGNVGVGYTALVEGRNGAIVFIVGVEDGEIIGYKCIEQGETGGIGSKVAESDFINSVTGKNIDGTIDTIAGATISSQAVIDGIEEIAEHYNENY